MEEEIGGCSYKNDIECIMNSIKIPIEIKKNKTPDWMQLSLKYDNLNNKWIGSNNNKIPNNSKKIFEDIIQDTVLFNGKIPPFINNKITHEEWIKIKKETTDYNDIYILVVQMIQLKIYIIIKDVIIYKYQIKDYTI